MIGITVIIVYAYNLGRVKLSPWIICEVVKFIINDLMEISTKKKEVNLIRTPNSFKR